LSEWEAYDRLEPIGEYRREYQMGMIGSMILNLAQSIYGRKDKRMVSEPTDFMPWFDDPWKSKRKVQSVEEMKEMLLSLGSVRKKKSKGEIS